MRNNFIKLILASALLFSIFESKAQMSISFTGFGDAKLAGAAYFNSLAPGKYPSVGNNLMEYVYSNDPSKHVYTCSEKTTASLAPGSPASPVSLDSGNLVFMIPIVGNPGDTCNKVIAFSNPDDAALVGFYPLIFDNDTLKWEWLEMDNTYGYPVLHRYVTDKPGEYILWEDATKLTSVDSTLAFKIIPTAKLTTAKSISFKILLVDNTNPSKTLLGVPHDYTTVIAQSAEITIYVDPQIGITSAMAGDAQFAAMAQYGIISGNATDFVFNPDIATTPLPAYTCFNNFKSTGETTTPLDSTNLIFEVSAGCKVDLPSNKVICFKDSADVGKLEFFPIVQTAFSPNPFAWDWLDIDNSYGNPVYTRPVTNKPGEFIFWQNQANMDSQPFILKPVKTANVTGKDTIRFTIKFVDSTDFSKTTDYAGHQPHGYNEVWYESQEYTLYVDGLVDIPAIGFGNSEKGGEAYVDSLLVVNGQPKKYNTSGKPSEFISGDPLADIFTYTCDFANNEEHDLVFDIQAGCKSGAASNQVIKFKDSSDIGLVEFYPLSVDAGGNLYFEWLGEPYSNPVKDRPVSGKPGEFLLWQNVAVSGLESGYLAFRIKTTTKTTKDTIQFALLLVDGVDRGAASQPSQYNQVWAQSPWITLYLNNVQGDSLTSDDYPTDICIRDTCTIQTHTDCGGHMVRTLTHIDPPLQDSILVEYLEVQGVNAGKYIPLTFNSQGDAYFGPSTGFPMTDGIESKFRITGKSFAEHSNVPVVMQLLDATSPSIVLAEMQKTVNLHAMPMLSVVGMDDKDTIICNYTEFQVSTGLTSTTCENKVMVKALIQIDPLFIDSLELQYKETMNSQWYPISFASNGKAFFGPVTGFPLINATSSFRISSKSTLFHDTVNYSFAMVDAVDTTVYGNVIAGSVSLAGLPTAELSLSSSITCLDETASLSVINITNGTNKIGYQLSTDGGSMWGATQTLEGEPGESSYTITFGPLALGSYMARVMSLENTVTGCVNTSTDLQNITVSVTALPEPVLNTDLASGAEVTCTEVPFSVSVVANCKAGEDALVCVELLNPALADSLELKYSLDGTATGTFAPMSIDNVTGKGYFGHPLTGFPLTDATSYFTLASKSINPHTGVGYNIYIVDAADRAITWGDSIKGTVDLVGLPTGNLSFSTTEICTGDTVTITIGTVTNGADTLTFTFLSGNNVPIGANIILTSSDILKIAPTSNAVAQLLLVGNTLTGCSYDVSGLGIYDTITVNQLPTANLALDKDTICVGESANFIFSNVTNNGNKVTYRLSTDNGATWGTVEELESPTPATSYTIPVQPIVTTISQLLSIENTMTGCVSDLTLLAVYDTLVVNPLPEPVITGTLSVCENTTETYGTESGKSNYAWTVTGGTIATGHNSNSITVDWTAAGTGEVIVTYSNGNCFGSDTIEVTINALPSPDITGNKTVCTNSTEIYSTASDMISYEWIVTGGLITSGGPTDMVTIDWGTAGSGTIEVAVTNTNGCTDTSLLVNIIIDDHTTPAITGAASVCAGSVEEYTTISGVAFYEWIVEEGTVIAGGNTNIASIQWNGTTIGTVKVVVSNAGGCMDTSSVTNVTILAKPEFSFADPDTVYVPATVDLSALTLKSGSIAGITSFTYYDNNFNSVGNIVSTEGVNQYYIVGVNASGCSDTAMVTVTILSSSDAYLDGLTASTGVLSPAFDSDMLDYTLTLSCGDNSSTITATPAQSGTVTMNGVSGNSQTFTFLEPGIQTLLIEVTSADGNHHKTYTVNVVIPFGTEFYKERIGNSLSVINNPVNNGGYQFTSFKWYKDNTLLQGETKNNIRPSEGGYYHAVVSGTDQNGKAFTNVPLCPILMNSKSLKMSIFPNPSQTSSFATIETSLTNEEFEDIVVSIYDIEGRLISIQNPDASLQVEMPQNPGSYIISLTTRGEIKGRMKVIVQ